MRYLVQVKDVFIGVHGWTLRWNQMVARLVGLEIWLLFGKRDDPRVWWKVG